MAVLSLKSISSRQPLDGIWYAIENVVLYIYVWCQIPGVGAAAGDGAHAAAGGGARRRLAAHGGGAQRAGAAQHHAPAAQRRAAPEGVRGPRRPPGGALARCAATRYYSQNLTAYIL